MDVQKEKLQPRKIQAPNQMAVPAHCWCPERLAEKFQSPRSAEDTSRSPGPALSWEPFSQPDLAHLPLLRPFSSLPSSYLNLANGWGIQAGARGTGGARGCRLPPSLAAGGRVLRKGAAAAGPRQRSPPPKPVGNSSRSGHGGCTPCAPGGPRHSPGRSRAGCSDRECGPGRSRPRRSWPGRSAEPWLCREHRRTPRPRERAASARAGRCGTGPDGTRPDATGRDGAGLRPLPGSGAPASRASRAGEPRPWPRFSPPLARPAFRRPASPARRAASRRHPHAGSRWCGTVPTAAERASAHSLEGQM